METILKSYYIDKTSPAAPIIEDQCLFVVGWNDDIIEIGKVWYPWHYSFEQAQPRLWGLLKGAQINDQDVEEAKKSLFPDRF